MSPIDGKRKLFETIEDVYKELELCYDEIMEKNINEIGATLYEEHFFFCNTYELLDSDYQRKIKKYNFSKTFSVPPYPTLQDTPAEIIDDFMLIENELKNIKSKQVKENN